VHLIEIQQESEEGGANPHKCRNRDRLFHIQIEEYKHYRDIATSAREPSGVGKGYQYEHKDNSDTLHNWISKEFFLFNFGISCIDYLYTFILWNLSLSQGLHRIYFGD